MTNLNAPLDMTALYFAYGSNLNVVEFRSILVEEGLGAGAIEPISKAYLPDMKLSFNYYSASRGGGALNVMPQLGSLIEGYLFRLSPEAWAILDAKEGHPSFYERTSVLTMGEDGRYIPAITYRVCPDRITSFIAPTPEYLKICIEGRQQLGLDERALIAVSANAPYPKLNALFCYGTLMRGESRFPIIARHHVKVSLLAQTSGQLLDLGTFPGLVPDPHSIAEGDFFRLDEIAGLLSELDYIEGFTSFGAENNLFNRTVVDVHVGDGRLRKAWTYILAVGEFASLPKHDWREHNGRANTVRQHILTSHARYKKDFFERLNQLINRFPVASNIEADLPSFETVLDGMKTGDISERRLAQASGLWAAGIGREDGSRRDL